MLGFGAIGWADDWIKIVKRDPNGMRSRTKYALQSLLGWRWCVPVRVRRRAGGHHLAAVQVGGAAAGRRRLRRHRLLLGRRFLQRSQPDRRPRWPGHHAHRAGGLRAGRVRLHASGNATFAQYLQIPRVPGAGELIIICTAIAGAGLGFPWFNTCPAMVFMGDIGALALGAVLGTIAVIVRQGNWCWC